MSILIKGMKMPTNCESCRFWYQDQDSEHNVWNRCTALNHKEIIPFITERREDCPLIEVLPHGRLIDADELEADAEWSERYDDYTAFSRAQINAAPTIIEAEEDSHE